MFETKYAVLNIFDEMGELKGRKRLQKIVHLLEHKGIAMNFRFNYHHYGPYSSDLQGETNELVDEGFLYEFQENGTYNYKITEKGTEFIRKLEESFLSELDKVYVQKNCITLLNGKSSQFLELVSTYAFLLETGYDGESAYSKARELKPHLAYMMDDAVEFYNQFINA